MCTVQVMWSYKNYRVKSLIQTVDRFFLIGLDPHLLTNKTHASSNPTNQKPCAYSTTSGFAHKLKPPPVFSTASIISHYILTTTCNSFIHLQLVHILHKHIKPDTSYYLVLTQKESFSIIYFVIVQE